MNIPKDPNMLYSLINMKLRDQYPNLEALCQDMNINRQDLVKVLKDAGFEYNEAANKFL